MFFSALMHLATFYEDLFIVTTLKETLLDRTKVPKWCHSTKHRGLLVFDCCQSSEKRKLATAYLAIYSSQAKHDYNSELNMVLS